MEKRNYMVDTTTMEVKAWATKLQGPWIWIQRSLSGGSNNK
jgi:hypothetical protein